jgi:hypothetical protein
MKASRLLWLVWMILTVVRSASFGQDAVPQPEVTRALLQAKTVYITSGHVRYYKTRGFLKKGCALRSGESGGRKCSG